MADTLKSPGDYGQNKRLARAYITQGRAVARKFRPGNYGRLARYALTPRPSANILPRAIPAATRCL